MVGWVELGLFYMDVNINVNQLKQHDAYQHDAVQVQDPSSRQAIPLAIICTGVTALHDAVAVSGYNIRSIHRQDGINYTNG